MIEVRTRRHSWMEVSEEDVRAWLGEASWIYHYDLIQTPSDRVEILDLAIPAFLGAPPNFKQLLFALDGKDGRPEMHAKLRQITEALEPIPQDIDLWDWPDNRENRSNLARLLSACRTRGYGVARITKMLHRKRPQLIPIVDDWAREAWSENVSQSWTIDDVVEITFTISRELGVRVEVLEEIQKVALELGPPYSGLSRLRLYDIVFWANESRIT